MKSLTILRHFATFSLCILTSACQLTDPITHNPAGSEESTFNSIQPLKITTWNVEHLAQPIEEGCKPRDRQSLWALQEYAKKLNSDVVGLQEVSSIQAVETLFPKSDWQIFISERPDSKPYTCRESGAESTQQKVAFAVKKTLKVNNVSSLSDFGLNESGLRYGLEIELDTPHGVITVLNLHLKSGCFVDDYSRSDKPACKTYAKQVPVLKNWVERKLHEGTPFSIIGDFNHRLSAPYNKLTRELAQTQQNTNKPFFNATSSLIGCHPYYPAPIDHILLGNVALSSHDLKPHVHKFDDMAPDAMLSDHCAVSLTLSNLTAPLTQAVKWQSLSKEYEFLTKRQYQFATEQLHALDKPNSQWVVVMDIDETILDNSGYQRELDRTGSTFSPSSWEQWVKEQKAGLVHGAKPFIESVFKQGGKIAMVTNRSRTLDSLTWQNLTALGLPLNTNNTCLMGRIEQDKLSIDGKLILNDKDLRRQQLKNGEASCYQPGQNRFNSFGKSSILMQVGDNIEDFEGVTQQSANIESLLNKHPQNTILLPNPMYGSW